MPEAVAPDWPLCCDNKLKLVVSCFSLSLFCVCVCARARVIRGILNIPPVCIAATQLLIKFPATNSRQHNDICMTMAAPPSLCHSEVVEPPHLSSLCLSFQSFRIAYWECICGLIGVPVCVSLQVITRTKTRTFILLRFNQFFSTIGPVGVFTLNGY